MQDDETAAPVTLVFLSYSFAQWGVQYVRLCAVSGSANEIYVPVQPTTSIPHLVSALAKQTSWCFDHMQYAEPSFQDIEKESGRSKTLYAVTRKQGCQLQIQETARSGSCSTSRQRMKCNATQQGRWGLACYLKTWQDSYRGEGVSIPNACVARHTLSTMAVNVVTQHWSPLQRRGFIPSVCKWIKTAKRWILWVIMAESLCKRGFCVVWNRRSGENRGNSCLTPEATFVFLAGNKLWVQGCVFFLEGWKQSR